MDELTCRAVRHDTTTAYRRYGCRCPEAVERVRKNWRRKYKPGTRHISRLLGDVDEVAVYRTVLGESMALTVRERRAVADRMTELGYTARQIGERLGITARTVQRYRAIHRWGKSAVDKAVEHVAAVPDQSGSSQDAAPNWLTPDVDRSRPEGTVAA